MQYKIISWNINSFFKRREQLVQLIVKEQPHFIFLQETRLGNKIPMEINGYYNYFHGYEGRNGVAILSIYPMEKILELNHRYMEYKWKEISFVCTYVYNGGSDYSPIEKKIEMIRFIANKKWNRTILGGDWNVIWNQIEINGIQNPYSSEEKNILRYMESKFKYYRPKAKYITWWDYRFNSLERNRGMGLDRFYWKDINVLNVGILKPYRHLPNPSDHAPVYIIIEE